MLHEEKKMWLVISSRWILAVKKDSNEQILIEIEKKKKKKKKSHKYILLPVLKRTQFCSNLTRKFWLQIFFSELSKFLRWSLMIFITRGFQTIVFVFIVIIQHFGRMSSSLLQVFVELWIAPLYPWSLPHNAEC